MARATTVRFTDEMYARLDQASARTGMPVNSIVVAACLEWMQRHTPDPAVAVQAGFPGPMPAAPRWATLRRALGQVAGSGGSLSRVYPFERFTEHAKEILKLAQAQAVERGQTYIGTEHLLLACFAAGSHSALVLAALGVERDVVDARLQSAIRAERHLARRRMVPTSRVKKVIEIAFGLGTERVGTEQILLALSQEGGSVAAHVLSELGATPDRIEHEVEALKDPES